MMKTGKKRAVLLSLGAAAFLALIAAVSIRLITGSVDAGEVVYDENGAIVFTDEDVEAALNVVRQYYEDEVYSVTDYRTYRIYYSNLQYSQENQTYSNLSGEYKKGYTEGNVIYLQMDMVWVLEETSGEGEWPEVERYPDYGVWLGREDFHSDWEIIGQGY